MLVSYAKQEIADPFIALIGYVGRGIVGAVCIAMSMMFFGLGTLRLLQGIDTFNGGGAGSIVPYLGAIFALLVMIGILVVFLARAVKRVK